MFPLQRKSFALLLAALFATVGLALWHEQDRKARDEAEAAQYEKRLASDAHFHVGGHRLVVPFIMLQRYSRLAHTFSLDRGGDSERARKAGEGFLATAASWETAPTVDRMTFAGEMYAWPESEGFCRLLARPWARSACENPWSVVRQALPYNRFTLISLTKLPGPDLHKERQCITPDDITTIGADSICRTNINGNDGTRFFNAVLKIDGDLGVLWSVWEKDGEGESASAMADREGSAIIAFVRYALGPQDDFAALRNALCKLRRPGSIDHPQLGSEC